MRTKRLGATSRRIPVIGQGTWQIATRGSAAERALEALEVGVVLGMTHIDTAEMYANGGSERVVGRLIRGRRQDLFVASKVLPNNASFEGTIAACERSLDRLATSYLDLYMIHWPGPHPIGETMAAMEGLVAGRKVRHIGVSNFDVEELREAERALPRNRIVANQVLYHLADRGIEHRLLPYCERKGVTVVAYSPFGSGGFPSPRSRGGRVLQEVARRRGGTPRQAALAFLTRHPRVVAIPKASHPTHVRENAGAAALRLRADDIAEIDDAFPLPPPDRPLGVI